MPSAPPDRPLRRDAQRNRERLIEVAIKAFQERGLDVGVDEIARCADVNIATLYRNFPTKAQLVIAATESLLEPLVIARNEALGPKGEGAALARFLHAAARLQNEHRGVLQALAQHPPDSGVRERLRESAVAILHPLVERAHADGTLDDDYDADDLLVAMRMIGAAAIGARDRDPVRYVDALLRGMRPAPAG